MGMVRVSASPSNCRGRFQTCPYVFPLRLRKGARGMHPILPSFQSLNPGSDNNKTSPLSPPSM